MAYIHGNEVEQMDVLNWEIMKNMKQEKMYMGMIKSGRLEQIKKLVKKNKKIPKKEMRELVVNSM